MSLAIPSVRLVNPARVRLEGLSAEAFRIPTDRPESDGTLQWEATTLVVVEARAGGRLGLGYTYADAAATKVVLGDLARAIAGRDAMDVTGCWWAMAGAVRNVGRPGLASMALSAVDMALWDLKARLLDLPVTDLAGTVRRAIPVYGSGGFTSYSIAELERQLGDWARAGIKMVKMKVGRDPHADPERVAAASAAIGPTTCLFVDANGAYSARQAVGMAERFVDLGVCWFEEPVSSDDLDGLRFVREHAPARMEIAAGEYGDGPRYFKAMLAAGAVDVLQADATRCGGPTGFLMAGDLCAAWGVPLSAHCAPSVHAPLCCMVQPARHLEFFHDHVRIEHMLFNGVALPQGGELAPDDGRPGFGLEFRRKDADRFLVR